jgi:hypothetical protein
MRRVLLVAVTALVVARPLVLGEDPGLSAPQSDNGTFVLSLLWLLVGLGWAAWRLGARRGEWYVGIIEAALGLAVVLFFISAATAANKHPARIIAWEWLVLLVGFMVVRHLAATPDARHGLFAAFLATGLMIAAYGLYQAAVELPALQAQTREKLKAKAAAEGLKFSDAMFEEFYKRAQGAHAFSTFSHPNGYAGYVALLLPGFAGAALVCLRNRADRRLTRLAAAVALLGTAALWTSHSRGALLAVAAVGLAAALIFGWQRIARKWLTLAAVAALGVAAVLVFRSGSLSSGLGKDTGTMAARLDYWRATAKMIGDHPWLGVGPGNFQGYYPRYMAATAGEKIKDPHNFVLELWATGGIFVLLAVLTALVALFVYVWRGTRNPSPTPPLNGEGLAVPSPRSGDVHAVPPPRSGEGARGRGSGVESFVGRGEYYAGGVLGLLLGFVLLLPSLGSPDQVLDAGIKAAARSLVWFLAFALFERIVWTDRQRLIALTAGVVALLLNLGVSGGISQPSVAGPLWFAAALALASLGLPPRVFARAPLPSLGLPVPVLGALALVYVVFCFYPVSSSLSLLREAERNAGLLQGDRAFATSSLCGTSAGFAADTSGPGAPLCATALILAAADQHRWDSAYQGMVLAKLHEATLVDPDNPRPWIRFGLAAGHYWQMAIWIDERQWTRTHVNEPKQKWGERAGGALHEAQKLDANGLEPLLTEVQLQLIFADASRFQAEAVCQELDSIHLPKTGTNADEERKIALLAKRRDPLEKDLKKSRDWEDRHLRAAMGILHRAMKLDPTDAPLHFQLAELLDRVGDHEECRTEAAKTLSFDAVSTHPPRKLSDPQRALARKWSNTEAEP